MVAVAHDRAALLELALPAPDGVAADAELPGVVAVRACRDPSTEPRIALHQNEKVVWPAILYGCYGSTSDPRSAFVEKA